MPITEKQKLADRIYRQTERGKDLHNERNKKYYETEKGKKAYTKRNWKKRGLDMDTFYYVYPIFLNAKNCERCGVEFEGRGSNQKCMDHCHSTGMFRNIVCRNCNVNIIPHI